MTRTLAVLTIAAALFGSVAIAEAPAYFTASRGLAIERNEKGVLLVTINDGNGGPITFTAQDHTEFTEAFYRIAQDRDNKVVILTGAGDFMAAIDFASFGNVADPDV